MTKLSFRIIEEPHTSEGKSFFVLMDEVINQHMIYVSQWNPMRPNEIVVWDDEHSENLHNLGLSDNALPNLMEQLLAIGKQANLKLRGHIRHPILNSGGC